MFTNKNETAHSVSYPYQETRAQYFPDDTTLSGEAEEDDWDASEKIDGEPPEAHCHKQDAEWYE